MRLRELIAGLEIDRIWGSDDVEIRGIEEDSRRVKPGYLFVALRGEKFDGHSFLQEAVNKGARCVAVEKRLVMERTVTLQVPDTRKFLSFVSSRFYGEPQKSLNIIGITGTNGKTTISYLIKGILDRAGEKAGRIGTINYEWMKKVSLSSYTTPQPLELFALLSSMVKEGVRFLVMEVSSHSLVLHRVDPLKFSSAIFTNLTRDHLDFHSSFESYFQAKLRLLGLIKEEGKVITNIDDEYFRKIPRIYSGRVITYGKDREADYWIEDWESSWEGIRMRIGGKGGGREIFLSLPGSFNLYNALSAITWAREEGYSWEVIRDAFQDISPVPGRFERLNHHGINVVVDYAHTPDALSKVLRSVKELTRGRVITVFGCGGNRDKSKRPFMGWVAETLSDWVIVTSDNPRQEDPEKIIQDILQGMSKDNHEVEIDRKEAIRRGIEKAEEGDTVLIAGKGHESYQCIGNTRIPFEDRRIAEIYLKEKGEVRV